MLRTVGLVALFVLALLNAVAPECYDQDPDLCRKLKDKCETAEFAPMLKERCKYSCGVCKECDDLYADYCALIKDTCHTARTRSECPDTCGVCREKCTDQRSDCVHFVNLCNDSDFGVTMRLSCAKSCGFCEEGPTAGCSGWIYSKAFGAWYKFLCEPLTFNEMEKRCVDDGGHLASVDSAAENAFLSTLNQCTQDHIWLGWSSDSVSSYRWTDLSAISYIPTLLDCGTLGNCRVLDAKNVGWCPTSCDATYGGVCKIRIANSTSAFATTVSRIGTTLK